MSAFLIRHAGWEGGRDGWEHHILLTFESGLSQRSRAGCPAIKPLDSLASRSDSHQLGQARG